MGAQQRDEVGGCGERCLVFVAAAAGVESAAVQQCGGGGLVLRSPRPGSVRVGDAARVAVVGGWQGNSPRPPSSRPLCRPLESNCRVAPGRNLSRKPGSHAYWNVQFKLIVMLPPQARNSRASPRGNQFFAVAIPNSQDSPYRLYRPESHICRALNSIKMALHHYYGLFSNTV